MTGIDRPPPPSATGEASARTRDGDAASRGADAGLPVRVLLAQLSPVPGAVEVNADRVAAVLAAHPDVDIAVFPELYLTGYDPAAAAGLAARCSGAISVLSAAAAAADTALVVGAVAEVDRGVANTAVCIDADGTVRDSHRKTYLFGPHEQAAFVCGTRLTVVELIGLRVAPLICFEIEFPELARGVARAGADLLVSIAANPHPYGPDHTLAARARALDNRRPHVYVNRVGDEGDLTFAGGSATVAADGRLTVEAGAGEELVVARLEVGGAVAPDLDYLRLLREPLPVAGRPHASDRATLGEAGETA